MQVSNLRPLQCEGWGYRHLRTLSAGFFIGKLVVNVLQCSLIFRTFLGHQDGTSY